jgi:hypothetical protein
MLAEVGALHTGARGSRRHQFGPRERRLEYAEQFFFLAGDRLLRVQFLFQRQTRLRLGKPEQPFAANEFDQVNLDAITVNHNPILHEIRAIATCGSMFRAKRPPILRAPPAPPARSQPR